MNRTSSYHRHSDWLDTLWRERPGRVSDLQHDQVIDDLKILNPFSADPASTHQWRTGLISSSSEAATGLTTPGAMLVTAGSTFCSLNTSVAP